MDLEASNFCDRVEKWLPFDRRQISIGSGDVTGLEDDCDIDCDDFDGIKSLSNMADIEEIVTGPPRPERLNSCEHVEDSIVVPRIPKIISPTSNFAPSFPDDVQPQESESFTMITHGEAIIPSHNAVSTSEKIISFTTTTTTASVVKEDMQSQMVGSSVDIDNDDVDNLSDMASLRDVVTSIILGGGGKDEDVTNQSENTTENVQTTTTTVTKVTSETTVTTESEVANDKIIKFVETESLEGRSDNVDTDDELDVIEVERKFVIPDDCESKLQQIGATLLKEHTFNDIYYDNNSYTLTLADHWLRKRNGSWELKCPPEQREENTMTQQYLEISEEPQILEKLKNVIQSEASTINDFLGTTKCDSFADFDTTRKTFSLDNYNIDLDVTNWGFKVGEIETIVVNRDRVSEAIAGIDSIADRLGLQTGERINGKIPSYLLLNRYKHYLALVEKGII